MALRRLTGLDAIFLAGESANNPLHIMAILVLDPTTISGGYSFEGFRDFIVERLHLIPPLRRRLIEVPFGIDRPTWVEEPSIDVDYHIRRAAVPGPGGPQEVAALAAQIQERLLDRSRPLWEMVLVEGLTGGNIGLIAKLSHAMMDGAAGVRMMATLIDAQSEVKPVEAAPLTEAERVPGSLELIARAIPSIARRPARMARLLAHAAQLQIDLWRSGDGTSDAAELEVPRTMLNARTTSRRAVATASLSLSEIKRIARHAGATVNDVLLAVTAGALRQYLVSRDALPEIPLVAGVPVSTHEEGDQLANAYTSVFASLETHLEDPAERLRGIARSTGAAKSRQGKVGGGIIQEFADVPPPWVFAAVAALYSKVGIPDLMQPMCNVIVSNVAGPPTDLYFGGARLVDLYPLGPIFDGMALNITVMSIGDTLDLGIVACRDAVPDLWRLADALPASLGELREAVGLEDLAGGGEAESQHTA